MTNASRALAALGDATRREIFDRLAEAPSSVGALAAALPVSRPAVSQHLRVLKEAGLVAETPDGARRIYRIDPRGIGAMRDWLDQHWDRALAAFKDFVEETEEPEA
ncbi:MAG TPA: metalloregulator ArsR/SmtB family transcription factor [Caulobacteraceae bacterium]|nr:metalloregulator ArsR/SmtB family transcription factor [Caulobacteraceae bacterium]